MSTLTLLFFAIATIATVRNIERSRLIKSQQNQIADLIGLLKRAKAAAPQLFEDVAD